MKLWNIPVWAWATGIAIGFAISIMMFDNLIVAAIFAVSIGTSFAIAFGATTKPGPARNDDAAESHDSARH